MKRFWSKVDVRGEDECWNWQASFKGHGYGQFSVGHSRAVGAHRMAWLLTKGPIPHGLHVLHRCDNRACCNPEHLFLGTNADNMADMKAKGRGRGGSPPGERNGNAKLTDRQVALIRAFCPGVGQRGIGRLFGVSKSQVGNIVRRESRRNLTSWTSSSK